MAALHKALLEPTSHQLQTHLIKKKLYRYLDSTDFKLVSCQAYRLNLQLLLDLMNPLGTETYRACFEKNYATSRTL